MGSMGGFDALQLLSGAGALGMQRPVRQMLSYEQGPFGGQAQQAQQDFVVAFQVRRCREMVQGCFQCWWRVQPALALPDIAAAKSTWVELAGKGLCWQTAASGNSHLVAIQLLSMCLCISQ